MVQTDAFKEAYSLLADARSKYNEVTNTGTKPNKKHQSLLEEHKILRIEQCARDLIRVSVLSMLLSDNIASGVDIL